MSLLTTIEERQARSVVAPRADSSRSLLVTVLGEFVRPHGGSAWTQTLIDAMAQVGVSEKATRQVLARLDERGWLHRTKEGRRTRWHLSDDVDTLLESGADRIYRHGRAKREWDGNWSVVLASVPDDGPGDRHRLNVALTWAGYGSLGNGTWVCPWADREVEAVAAVTEAGVVDPTSFVGELGALGGGPTLAARAWDLDALAMDYRRFADDIGPEVSVPLDGNDAFTHVVDTVHRWRRFPALDPQLPAELLPGDWPIERAAAAFSDTRTVHGPAAATWWFDRERRYGQH